MRQALYHCATTAARDIDLNLSENPLDVKKATKGTKTGQNRSREKRLSREKNPEPSVTLLLPKVMKAGVKVFFGHFRMTFRKVRSAFVGHFGFFLPLWAIRRSLDLEWPIEMNRVAIYWVAHWQLRKIVLCLGDATAFNIWLPKFIQLPALNWLQDILSNH